MNQSGPVCGWKSLKNVYNNKTLSYKSDKKEVDRKMNEPEQSSVRLKKNVSNYILYPVKKKADRKIDKPEQSCVWLKN